MAEQLETTCTQPSSASISFVFPFVLCPYVQPLEAITIKRNLSTSKHSYQIVSWTAKSLLMSYWDYLLLIAGFSLLAIINDSQPRFLAFILVFKAVLGMGLLGHDLFVIPGVWYIGSAVHLALNLIIFALSPAQLLLLLVLKPRSKPKTGIVVHHPDQFGEGETVEADIVAVHGLGSNPDWAWKHEGKGVMWLKDLLPKDIPNVRIMTFNHNSKWDIDASVKSVDACGQELLDTLNLHRESDKKRPIIFIGHSFGGIIIKKALVIAEKAKIGSRYEYIEDSTIGIVFLGVPHNGSALTMAGKLMSYCTYWLGSSTELLEALEPGAKILGDLNDSFLSAYRNHKLVNFYERWKTKTWGIPLLLAVDEGSGGFVGRTRIGLEADHVGMNKFGSAEDNNYQLVRKEIQDMMRIIPGYSEDEFEECLKSLAFEGMDDRKHAIPKREEPSFEWVWNDRQFVGWLNDGPGVFLVLGNPGCGKSVFSKYVFENLTSKLPHGATIVGFFFDDRGEDCLANSLQGFLQALLHQILSQTRELSIHIIREYKLMKKKSGTREFKWPLEILSQVLLRLLDSCNTKPIYIFIDAADECDGQSRERLSDLIVKLCDSCTNSRLRIFIANGYDQQFLSAQSKVADQANIQAIKLHEKSKSDIEIYIKSQVKRLPEHLRNFIEYYLLDRAQGVFLWVKVVVIDLEIRTPSGTDLEMQRALDLIPKELNKLYIRLLKRLRPEFYDETKSMLQWAVLAKRSLSLKEFRYAIAIGQHKFSSHRDFEQSPCVPASNKLELRIRIHSGGFLEAVGTDDYQTVQLIHRTARKFLMTPEANQEKAKFQISPPEGHAHLATVCVSYLQFSDFTIRENFRKDRTCPFEKDAGLFQQYVGEYWIEHARIADESKALDPNPIMEFVDPESMVYPNWIASYEYASESRRIFGGNSGEEWSSVWMAYQNNLNQLIASMISRWIGIPGFRIEALRAAACYSHEWSVRALLENGAGVNVQNDKYGSALQAAACYGHTEMVQFLIDKGANVNARGGEYKNSLYAASFNGHGKVAKILIDNGADPNDQHGGDALYAAALNGHNGVVNILIDNGFNVNTKCGIYGNALQAASNNGHEKVVRTLIEKKADVNAKGGTWCNALQAAAFNGHESVVLFLIENGAKVNAQAGECGNALYAAALNDHEKSVKLLIENGANVDAQGGEYGNALQAAACYGNRSIQTLIDNKANVNAPNGDYGGDYGGPLLAAATYGHNKAVRSLIRGGVNFDAQSGGALRAAACHGHDKVVWTLVEEGANVNDQGSIYGNALQAAAFFGHENVVHLLIKKGAEIDFYCGKYGRALQAAAFNGHEVVVQSLIDGGANVNAHGGIYGSALQAAAFSGHQAVVRILVENKAHVNAQGGEYGNALKAAKTKGNLAVAQFLIENGAEGSLNDIRIQSIPDDD